MSSIAYEILKAAKKPLNFNEAKKLENLIIQERKISKSLERLHAISQDIRIKIQGDLGFSCDDYFKLIHEIL